MRAQGCTRVVRPQKAATSVRGPQDTQRQKVAWSRLFRRCAGRPRGRGAPTLRPPCPARGVGASAQSRACASRPHRAPAAWALRRGRRDSRAPQWRRRPFAPASSRCGRSTAASFPRSCASRRSCSCWWARARRRAAGAWARPGRCCCAASAPASTAPPPRASCGCRRRAARARSCLSGCSSTRRCSASAKCCGAQPRPRGWRCAPPARPRPRPTRRPWSWSWWCWSRASPGSPPRCPRRSNWRSLSQRRFRPRPAPFCALPPAGRLRWSPSTKTEGCAARTRLQRAARRVACLLCRRNP